MPRSATSAIRRFPPSAGDNALQRDRHPDPARINKRLWVIKGGKA